MGAMLPQSERPYHRPKVTVPGCDLRHLQRQEQLGGSDAWRSMLVNRLPLAFGYDVRVEHPDPFAGLAVAISREDAHVQPPWRVAP